MRRKRIILNGKDIGSSPCQSCAVRFVRLYLLKETKKWVKSQELRAGMKANEDRWEFTYEGEGQELPGDC